MHVTVIGGGIIGLCSAYYLEKEGLSVTVIDRGDISDGCSFGNMGFMSPSHFIPLASPGIIAEGFRYMLNSSSPFYIKPKLNTRLLQWCYHFWKSSNAATVKKNAPHLNNLLQLSRQLMNDMRKSIGDGYMMETKGCLMICKKQKTLQHEFKNAKLAEQFGLDVVRLSSDQLRNIEPAVSTDVAGAVLFNDDCHFHPGDLMKSIYSYLKEKGVQFELHSTVTGFENCGDAISNVITDKGKFSTDSIVLAAGSWLPELTAKMGIPLLLQPGKGYSYTYADVENNICYPAILVDGRCAITPWQKQLRIGGTMEISGMNNKILFNRVQGIYNSVKDTYPGLQIDIPVKSKTWQGMRPLSADGLPYIGKTGKYKNVIIAGGHAMLGMSECTGTGKLVSELMQNR